MGVHPTGDLADALVSCGIKPEDVKVDRDDVCQEDVLTFSATNIPNAALIKLADLYLSFPSRFVFASEELDDAFQGIVSTSPRMVALQNQVRDDQHKWLTTRGLSAFPPFDPESERVSEFAARVEIACGTKRGDLLSVRGDTIWVNPGEPGRLPLDRIKTLMALLETSARDLPYFMIGHDAGDVG